ncbi:MAG: methyltransferase domain-containing protein [Polyangia bacterium]
MDDREKVNSALPAYEKQLARFHRAFERELEAIVAELPLDDGMRVLDLACGDGFYTRRIAERLGKDGAVVAVDISCAYLAEARKDVTRGPGQARVDLVAASLDQLPFPDGVFDLVWCAQSLFSLPDPVVAVRHMARVVRPGGVVAVLENDTLHQVLLPWPVNLELSLRTAELRCLSEYEGGSSKFYVGRRLPAIFAAAGLEPVRLTTHGFDRLAPLAEVEQALLQTYLDELSERVAPYLDDPLLAELRRLVDPASPQHLLRQPHLSLTWLNVLAFGRSPG